MSRNSMIPKRSTVDYRNLDLYMLRVGRQ